METNAQDREIAAPHARSRRLPPRSRISHIPASRVQDEPVHSQGQLMTGQGAGRLLALEKEQAVVSSFEPLIDSATAAELLKVHRKTLERLALRGEVPGHKVGKFWRFRASELDEWLRSGVNSGRQPCCTTTF
jgi:excisionase family DNA binding protein